MSVQLALVRLAGSEPSVYVGGPLGTVLASMPRECVSAPARPQRTVWSTIRILSLLLMPHPVIVYAKGTPIGGRSI